MTKSADITSEIQAARPPVKIDVTTSGPWDDSDKGVIVIKLTKDHPNWDLRAKWGEHAVEKRTMPDHCLSLDVIQNATSKEYEWSTFWNWDPEAGFNTNHLEIYGVLRAEHRFFDLSWQKIKSKIGNHGFDSLFKKGTNWVVCESKAGGTARAVADYAKFLQMHPDEEHSERLDWSIVERKKDMVRARLGRGGIKWKKGETFPEEFTETKIREMTTRWVETKVHQMIMSGGDLHLTGEHVGRALRRGRVARYFNFFAAHPLFALPGVYELRGSRFAEFRPEQGQAPANKKIFDWPDSKSRLHREFIWLDVHEPFLRLEAENEAAVDKERHNDLNDSLFEE